MWTCKGCEGWKHLLLDQISPGSRALADLPQFFTSDLSNGMLPGALPRRTGQGCLHRAVFGDE